MIPEPDDMMLQDDEDAALHHEEELKQREFEEQMESYHNDMVDMYSNAQAWEEWCKAMDEWYEEENGGSPENN